MAEYTRPKLNFARPLVKCPVCDVEFEQNRPWKDFCSQKCQTKYYYLNRKIKLATAPTDRLKKGK